MKKHGTILFDARGKPGRSEYTRLSQAYSNETYGTKVKKAVEYNEKDCSISIIKESDFFAGVK